MIDLRNSKALSKRNQSGRAREINPIRICARRDKEKGRHRCQPLLFNLTE
jgi:hypothetical protein